MVVTQTFDFQQPVAVGGSFLALVPLLAEQMRAGGYAPASMKSSIGLVRDFAAWLDQRETPVYPLVHAPKAYVEAYNQHKKGAVKKRRESCYVAEVDQTASRGGAARNGQEYAKIHGLIRLLSFVDGRNRSAILPSVG